MDDDWHSLYPTLCRIGRVQDWVEWQVDLASALGAMQPWHCGRVDELMNACEAALFDAMCHRGKASCLEPFAMRRHPWDWDRGVL